jgi:parvulin-like peptidyl-prolyl isomerase
MLTKIVAESKMPDSVKVRHILIPFIGANSADPSVTVTLEQAKKTADSVLAIVKSNRSKFPELVTALSSDKGSVEKGGEYDFHPQNTMIKDFNDFEFENKIGDIGVVETVFGFHIIEILNQKNMQRAIKVATLAQEIEPSEKTINEVFNQVSKFEIAANEDDYQAIAKEKSLTVKPVNTIKVLDENIPGLGNQRQIVRWAFEEDAKVGDIKRFNLASGGYAMVQLAAKNKEGLMSVASASASALPAIRNEKKAKMIRERISATTLEAIAEAEKQQVKTANGINMKNPTLSGAGREPKVIGTAFGLAEGATSGLIDGAKGVYIIQVTKITPATGTDNAYQAAANRLGTTKSGAVSAKLYNALKEASEIEDNRADHF